MTFSEVPAVGRAASPEALDERQLVLRARRGDVSAQNELARRHRDPAFFFALQLLGHRDDAMDVVQDALLRFLTTLDRFDPRRPVRPWLFQIVRNRVLDLHRRRRVRRHDSIEEADHDADRAPLQIVDERIDLDRDLQRMQLQKRLWRALGELSVPHREILVLRDYQDLSYADIASTLGIPLGTVMSRLHAARKALRRLLADELETLVH
ncbi:MAG: sigma-70 family RNA polymerase sigma factor [Acidobacteriota bacterium]